MNSINTLKAEGNGFYKAGMAITSKLNPVRKQYFVDACVKYAQALEEIAVLEHEGGVQDQLVILKQSLFLNLAVTNFQLEDYTQCRRCCNAAIAFLNNPSLFMNDLGEEHDLNVDQTATEPILPKNYNVVAKALFRRAKSLFHLYDYKSAFRDISQAVAIMPDDKNISIFHDTVRRKCDLEDCKSSKSFPLELTSGAIELDAVGSSCMISSSTSHMCHNGGLCNMRRGYWSQSIMDATVHLPMKNIISDDNTCTTREAFLGKNNSPVKVEFTERQCLIRICTLNSESAELTLFLANDIVPNECTWYTSNEESVEYLVIILHKAPPLSIFTGCEWWERVFDEDEKIDIWTCSVGADVSQLPQHACDRAYKEHARMQNLKEDDREKELVSIANFKQMFQKAEANTRSQSLSEDKAIQDVPERASMLEALRNEFPHIQFSAK